MWALTWQQLWHRGARTLILGFAIVLAATGFAVLTASSDAARLKTVGTVRDNAVTTYDILVRPAHSRSDLETSRGLIQPGFLTGTYGGITFDQWHQIQRMHDVAVAAPIAMLGYAYPSLHIPVRTSTVWGASGTSVARVDVTWAGDNGLTRTHASPDFAATTDRPLRFNSGASSDSGAWTYTDKSGKVRDICPVVLNEDQRPEHRAPQILCFSRTRGGEGTGYVGEEYRRAGVKGVIIDFPLSYVVAAVDPASEDALVGLDQAMTSGTPLAEASLQYADAIGGRGVPVLIADHVGVDETAHIKVSSLPRTASDALLDGAGAGILRRFTPLDATRIDLTAQQAHESLLSSFRHAKPIMGQLRPTRFLPGEITSLGQVSQPDVTDIEGTMRVVLRPSASLGRSYDQVSRAPASDEPMARAVTSSEKQPDHDGGLPSPATLRLQGTFDPQQLGQVEDLTGQILAGYATAPTEGADATTKRLLGGRPLQPSTNLGGFVQPAPTMITTLSAVPQLTRGWSPTTQAAPISAIRVRVSDAETFDEASRERIRLAAQRIRAATGLEVDITTGSSAGTQTIVLPAGKHGRPELALSQWWVKKGVATQILKEVDKKSLALFLLVLLVSALSVANAAVAAVRARRTELGVLASLGWRRGDLFRSVLYELGFVAGVAGMISVVLALGVGWLLGTPVGLARAGLALPAAFAVALAAGAVPAMLAARADPMNAVRPMVSEPRRPRHAGTVIGLAALNLTLSKTRSALASSGLVIAVATATVLLSIMLGFQGAVVGTLLGDTVSVETRTADYAATAATLLLACLGVTNVMYLNIRDRGRELATLRAVGWNERDLDRLITAEGTLMAVLGTTPGALIGMGVAALLIGELTSTMVGGALLAWAVATCLASASAYAATVLIRQLPTSDLLTE